MNQFKKPSEDTTDQKKKKKKNKPKKYRAKFEIQIDNEEDFKVGRRIIGQKGANMKKVLDICNQKYITQTKKPDIKLRLRGKGSKFKEGPYKKESSEPLHLCVISKHIEKFNLASLLVKDLLSTVYNEYKQYRIVKDLSPRNLSIKLLEN
jgi:hypothetical protein